VRLGEVQRAFRDHVSAESQGRTSAASEANDS
jgi:hypothetical protein